MGSQRIGKLYKRGDIWYFKITTPEGRRIQKSTGKKLKREALEYAERYLERILNSGSSAPAPTLRSELERYIVPEKNPRYVQAQMLHKVSYTLSYAYGVARQCRYLIETLDEKMPEILETPVDQIDRRKIKEIQVAIVESRGRCRTSQHMFGTLKTVYSYMVDDSIVQQSPAANIPDIGYDKKQMIAIDAELIAWLLDSREIFPSDQCYRFLAILATTGMRLSEGMALSSEKIFRGTLMIDQQVSRYHDHMVKPKCGIIRTIPLSRFTQAIIAEIKPDSDGRYFPDYSYSKIARDMNMLRIFLMREDKLNASTWKRLTPHLLRHSINTNLLVAGCPEMLTAEYLGWHHQTMLDMQKNYTHLKAKKLQTVADTIDMMYATSPKRDGENIMNFFNQGGY